MGTLSYTRSLPVRHEADVLVAGGGPAGVAAALRDALRTRLGAYLP